jgi:hypothetical protein
MMIAALFFFLGSQDLVDNPEFKAWASFKPGSSVTFTYLKDGKASTLEQKTTLKSVADDLVVVETQMILEGKAGGQAVERKVAPKLPADQAGKKLRDGDEEIEAGGRKLACRWGEFEKKVPGGKTVISKIWVHDDVPGRAVRMEFSTDGVTKTGMVASAWDRK